MKDMKEALGSTVKPDLTHVRKGIMVYIARACEFGSFKYERGNYLRQVGDQDGFAADFERLRSYLRAALGHVVDTLDAMEMHLAIDPDLEDDDGMLRAAYAADDGDIPKTSGLPHLAHAAASLMMAIEQAVVHGLLPEDPGQPWADVAAAEEGDE